MKIGLIDVDGHNFPNLPLMKISAYHKADGDTVEWLDYLTPHDKPYDIVYKSKVFPGSRENPTCIPAKQIISGGTGYGLENRLPGEIETIYPDYSLYGVTDTAFGFLTRGCPRNCGFCIVGEKEGLVSYKVADLSQFWNGQKHISLLDPNITACRQWRDLFGQLEESRAWVDFTQGIDIRLMTEEKAEALKKIKVKMIHFAWDNADEDLTERFKMFKGFTTLDHRKLGVYVLTNYNTTHEQDLYRVYRLRELGYDPYVMVFDKKHSPDITRKLAGWVNNKRLWNTVARLEDLQASHKAPTDEARPSALDGQISFEIP